MMIMNDSSRSRRRERERERERGTHQPKRQAVGGVSLEK
jgi:hypothetical protein